jgi:hypothetical protein
MRNSLQASRLSPVDADFKQNKRKAKSSEGPQDRGCRCMPLGQKINANANAARRGGSGTREKQDRCYATMRNFTLRCRPIPWVESVAVSKSMEMDSISSMGLKRGYMTANKHSEV